MADLSVFLFVLLQFVFWLALIYIAWSWLLNWLAPKNTLRRRLLRRGFSLISIEPIRQSYRGIHWATERVIANSPQYRSHKLYLENYPVTPLQLYAAIEQDLLERQIIGVRIGRIARLEWHLLSARRIYLLIRCREIACFVSGVPFGTGLLVSWRYTTSPGRILLTMFQVPYFGFIAEKLFRPATFYREDYHHAFERAIRETVLQATNRLTVQQNVRPLQENEARPLLRDFYQT
jgi:hypothetical protein